jgi:hypothetical protein
VDKGKNAQIAQRPGIKGDEKTMESWRWEKVQNKS